MSSYEEIRPRELKPALLELDGISRASIEAHYKLYQGYVTKRNEILGKLGGVDLGSANQVYSELRALKVELSLRDRRDQEPRGLLRAPRRRRRRPDGRDRRPDQARLRLGRTLARRPQGDRDGRPRLGLDGVRLGRGPALQLRRRRPEHLSVWNATPLVALDVYEHAYFLDFQTDRGAYIDAFFDNLDWAVVNDWVSKYQHSA